MNIFSSIKTAFSSIWRNKLTSLLAVLGVVIGVASVSTLVSVGEGLKHDVSGLIQGMGTNVIAIISGKIDLGDPQAANQANPASFVSTDILTEQDVHDIQAMDNIDAASPVSLVLGNLVYGDETAAPTLVGVYPSALQAVEVLGIDKGKMFEAGSHEKEIVLGPSATDTLFGDEDPVGKKVEVGKNGKFTVVGTMGESSSSAAFASEFETMSYIPFDTAKDINNGEAKIMRILVKANDNADVSSVKDNITQKLTANHDGEEDFTVLTQDDILDLFSQFLNMATALVSAIAAISVVVGGIGIMNIMLVSVTERTREIGIRKAVGATNGAIMTQFLIESVVITALGGAIGLAITFLAGYILRLKTTLSPAITADILIFAVALSVFVGVIFGLLPAIRASRKNPIEALRYE